MLSHSHSHLGLVLALVSSILCNGAGAAPLHRMRQTQPPRPAPGTPRPQASRDVMAQDARLQQSVEVGVVQRPLKNVLASLSAATRVQLRAGEDIKETRVSLHLKGQTLREVMANLQHLFAHGHADDVDGFCRWQLTDPGDTPSYTLVRTRRAEQEERSLLDFPRRKVARWLTELRAFSQMSREQRRHYRTDMRALRDLYIPAIDTDLHDWILIYCRVMAMLSDAQFNQLLDRGRVEVPQFKATDKEEEYLRARYVAINTPPPGIQLSRPFRPKPLPPSGDPPSQAVLEIEQFASLGWRGYRSLRLAFVSGFPAKSPYNVGFDTLDEVPAEIHDDLELKEAQLREKNKEVDLFAHVKPEDRAEQLPFKRILELLAQEAGFTIYAEMFPKLLPLPLKPGSAYLGTQVDCTRGKPEYLLSVFCKLCGYEWRKVGATYLVTCKGWPQQRQADVAEDTINKWLGRPQQLAPPKVYGLGEGGPDTIRLPLPVMLEMAKLTDPQLETLSARHGLQNFSSNVPALRLAGLLRPQELRRAREEDGTVLPPLNGKVGEWARQAFRSRSVADPVRLRLRDDSRGTRLRLTDATGQTVEHFAQSLVEFAPYVMDRGGPNPPPAPVQVRLLPQTPPAP